MIRKLTISVLVNDEPGVLQRVTGLLGRRGFNIDSITVGSTGKQRLSRMIIVTSGDERTMEQVNKQLQKLIDVIEVTDLSSCPMVARELVLIKVKAEPVERPEIVSVVDTFRASIIDIGPGNMIIQAIGEDDKIEAMIKLLQPYGILELARTGTTAMMRGESQYENEIGVPVLSILHG